MLDLLGKWRGKKWGNDEDLWWLSNSWKGNVISLVLLLGWFNMHSSITTPELCTFWERGNCVCARKSGSVSVSKIMLTAIPSFSKLSKKYFTDSPWGRKDTSVICTGNVSHSYLHQISTLEPQAQIWWKSRLFKATYTIAPRVMIKSRRSWPDLIICTRRLTREIYNLRNHQSIKQSSHCIVCRAT